MFKNYRSLSVAFVAISLFLLSPVQLVSAWSTPLRVSGSTSLAHVPGVAVGADGTVHTVWAEEIFLDGVPTDREIYYSRSTNAGLTFSTPINISTSPNNVSGEPVISVAADQSNEIHVVWEESNLPADPNGTEIMYARSVNAGVTWLDANKTNVSQLEGSSGSPYIFIDALAAHNIHIAWTDYGGANQSIGEVRYKKSANGGTSFSSPVVVSTINRDAEQATIAADATAIQVVWQQSITADQYDPRIYQSSSVNGGSSFATPKRLSTGTVAEIEPSVIIDGSARVHAVWETANLNGGGDIFWTRSTNNGSTFAVPANRSNNPSTSSQTSFIGASGNKIDLFWVEDTGLGTKQPYTVRSSNGGNSWQSANLLGPATETASEPNLFIKGSVTYAVWEDTAQIYFTKE